MKHLHEGLDYKLYNVYIWGGLPLLVIFITVAVLVFDALSLPGPLPFFLIFGSTMLWVTGILLYWWWVILFKGREDEEKLARERQAGLPKIKALKSWSTLHRAMTIYGGSVKEMIKYEKKANQPVIILYDCMNLLVIWIFGFITLGVLKVIPGKALGVMLAGVFVWIGLMLLATYLLLGWGAMAMEKAYLAPLGLAITRIPALKSDVIGLMGGGQVLIPDGPAIVEGERRGRLVHIETIDKHSLTVLQATLPEFKVISQDGKLTPSKDTPAEGVKAFKSLRKAKRWKGVEVYACSEGIAIQRESKGTNMWLYDLWLAEYLAEHICK